LHGVRDDLPSGTVTFLFTDVEGSTRLLHRLGAGGYADALAEHRRVIREACDREGGVEVDTQGDAFFFAFPTAAGAASAAAAICDALASGSIQVRVGVHTGAPLLTDEGYVGEDVHRAARVAAAGHGGQVLVSASTRALLEGVELRDLGEHRFKDLAAAERVYQLGTEVFPPLSSLYRTNLPVPATGFLGRERELAEVVELLARDDVRLLTLVGPGGTGKTRLAVQAAAENADLFPEGVWWVPLAPLRDSAVVLAKLAEALELRDEGELPVEDNLLRALAGSRRLVLLDSAEHLLPDIADSVALLREIEGPTLLVTSRERLQLQGEQVYPVPPLAPEDGVQLLAARARALDPSFVSDGVVSELCERLENLPLAIELAAARTQLFSPRQLLDRLGQRLDLLKGGRDADPRHRTLRATITWSYELLDEEEQRLLTRLSVFAGGCTYEAAEKVGGATPDALQSLLDKSLIKRRDTEAGPRYWMLETIREYADEQLESLGGADGARDGHAEYFAALADRTDAEIAHGHWTPELVNRMGPELDNLRTALALAIESGSPELQLRLALGLAQACANEGRASEPRAALEDALQVAPSASADLRARALTALAWTAVNQNDLDLAEDAAAAALDLVRGQGNELRLAVALNLLGSVRASRGDNEAGQRLLSQAAGLLHDRHPLAVGVDINLGFAALGRRDFDRAVELFEQARATASQLGLPAETVALSNLGLAALLAGRPDEATTYYRDALLAAQGFGHSDHVCYALEGLAESWIARGHALTDAVRLFGVAAAARAELGTSPYGAELEVYENSIIAAQQKLGEKRYSHAMTEGKQLTLDAAISLALSIT
jgi:predicted ATPase